MSNQRIILRDPRYFDWKTKMLRKGLKATDISKRTGYSYQYVTAAIRAGGKGYSKECIRRIEEAIG